MHLSTHILSKALLVAVIATALPLSAFAETTVPSGSLSLEACVVGKTPSYSHPTNTNVCDSYMWWHVNNARSAYVVITGDSAYSKERFPFGYVYSSKTLAAKERAFWTTPGTYTVTLYANGTAPTQKKNGTGTLLDQDTITVLPRAYTSPLLESKVHEHTSGVEMLQQPKGWEALDFSTTAFYGMSGNQTLFTFDDEHGDEATLKVTRLENIPEYWNIEVDAAIELLERAYTTPLNKDVLRQIQRVFDITKYEDTANIIYAQEKGYKSTLLSKKPIAIGDARGFELTFSRTNGYGEKEIIKHALLQKGNTYYEVVVVVPKSLWRDTGESIVTSLKTLRI